MNSNICEQDRMISAHLLVSGKVQGVGFRKFSQASALKLRLLGTVRNLMDGRVELQVEGEREKIETLIKELEVGPHRSKVEKVGVSWKATLVGYTVFSIML
jgi:acylphosphatase